MSRPGILGLGDGSNGTLYMTLNTAGDKTYIKSAEADADGNRFEIALNGNYLNTLTASDFVFASAPSKTSSTCPPSANPMRACCA